IITSESRSHALRGNAVLAALRPRRGSTGLPTQGVEDRIPTQSVGTRLANRTLENTQLVTRLSVFHRTVLRLEMMPSFTTRSSAAERRKSTASPLLVATALALVLLAPMAAHAEGPIGIYDPSHGYDTRTPTDRFTRFKSALESGRATLDPSGELPLL